MVNNYQRTHTRTLAVQMLELRAKWHNIIEKISLDKGLLTVVLNIRPTESSCIYKILLECKENGYPSVWLLNPAVRKFKGKLPHHIYSASKRHSQYINLCVCNFRRCEWTRSDSLAKYIPFISTWLWAYENWQITGIWHYDESFPVAKKKK